MEPRMKKDLVLKGLTALARAGATSWFDGHFGAATLAGALLLERADLSAEVKSGVSDQIRRAEDAKPPLFIPFETTALHPEPEAALLEALLPNLEKLSISGHGIIYGVAALRAVRENPELGTREIIDGIVQLLGRTLVDKRNRYYGVENYQTLPLETQTYASVEAMAMDAFAESKVLCLDGKVGEAFYYFTAEKLHGLTLAHALRTLWDLGYRELATKGFAVHKTALKLNRMSPPDAQNRRNVGPFGVTPFQASYWKKDHFDDHGLKLAAATLELLDGLTADQRAQVYDSNTFWGPFLR